MERLSTTNEDCEAGDLNLYYLPVNIAFYAQEWLTLGNRQKMKMRSPELGWSYVLYRNGFCVLTNCVPTKKTDKLLLFYWHLSHLVGSQVMWFLIRILYKWWFRFYVQPLVWQWLWTHSIPVSASIRGVCMYLMVNIKFYCFSQASVCIYL